MSAKQDQELDSSRSTIVHQCDNWLALLQLAPINQWKEELSIALFGGAELLFYLDKQLC